MTKTKFQQEFVIHVSPSMLYQYFTSPSNMGEWFADNVNSRGSLYTFIWEGAEEQAELIQKKPDESARYKWLEDDEEETYFEFAIVVDDITKDVSLVITDFAEEDEIEEAKMLWQNQINDLKHNLGA